MQPLLRVQNLKMYYETVRGHVKAVDDVSFDVKKRESVGLAGESGCGKTSTALTVISLLPSNAEIVQGNITFDGEDIVNMKEDKLRKNVRWKKISMIFQGAMNALHPTYTVGDQIAEAILEHEDVSKKEALERARRLIEVVGIEREKVSRYPHELSGGMKQRAVTAMALACNPQMVIADEPTTALDVIVQAQVLKAIKDLQSRLELSWMLITHDLSMIAETCTKAAIMYAGKIVEYGDVVPIFQDPLHPYTEKLINAFPSILGPRRELSSIRGSPPDLLKPPQGCRFHPRCTYAMQICKTEEPSLEEYGSKRQVACHLRS